MSAIARQAVAMILATVLLAGGCTGQAPAPAPTPHPVVRELTVDGERAMDHVRHLVNIGPRPSNSQAARESAEYLAAQARQLGYQATIDTWTEPTDHGPMTFHNVYAELPGRRPGFLLLGSHFDTKRLPTVPNFVGANDSGSSTGLLLEIMRVLHAAGDWQGRTIRFAFFDGEEAVARYTDGDGLHGSRRLARRLRDDGLVEQCRAMILLDMIGDADLKVTLFRDQYQSKALIDLYLANARLLGTEKHVGVRRGSILDDHVPFAKLGIPTIDIIDFDYGPGNAWWHTDRDTLDRLSPRSLETVGNIVLRMVQQR